MKRLQFVAMLVCLLLVLPGCGFPAVPASSEPPSPATSAPAPVPSEPSPEAGLLTPPEPSTPTVQLPDVIGEVPKSTGLITRCFKWMYNGAEWSWDIKIPQSLYDYYKGIPRPPTQNYSVYVTHPWDDTVIGHLVSEVERFAQSEGFSDFEKVEFTAAFVQSLPYTADSVTTPYDEYPRYPLETLVDAGGDCEDTSILLASLLNAMGYGVILVAFPRHCAAGVLCGEGTRGAFFEYGGGKYFYVETTNTGWGIGDIPEEYQGVKAYLYDMTPAPILTHAWTARGEGSVVKLEVTVQNLGSAGAYGVYVLAGFDAGEGVLWNAQQCLPFQLLINERITVTFSLDVPPGKHTRLVVQIIDGGYAVDESYSEWIDT